MNNYIKNEGVMPSYTLKIWDTTPKTKVVGSHGTVADHVHRSHYFQLFSTVGLPKKLQLESQVPYF